MTTDPKAATDGRRDLERLLATTLAVAVAWNLIGNLVLPGEWYVPANLMVAAGLVALGRRAGLGWDDLGLRCDRVGRGFRIGTGALVLVGAALLLALSFPAFDGALESDQVRGDSRFEHWFVPVVRIPLGTAVFEETIFRGVLLGAAWRLWTPRTAIVGSSVAFGLWHVVPAWESASGSAFATTGAIVGTVLLTTLAGAVFALLRVWADSLLAPVLAHTATNSLAYVAALVALDLI